MSDFSDSQPSKTKLRKQGLAIRATLPMTAISEQICAQLAAWTLFQQARKVLFYHPIRNEVDLLPLAEQFPDKRWYLPVVANHDHLEFFHYHPQHTLNSGKYGIQEPLTDSDPLHTIHQTDLLLAPGLMFDRQGYRLGYGKGYFDKFFQKLAEAGQQPIRAGIVPSLLFQETLPHDPWDTPMDYLITESGIVGAENTSSA